MFFVPVAGVPPSHPCCSMDVEQFLAAKQRLRLAGGDQREPPELSIKNIRAASAATEPSEVSIAADEPPELSIKNIRAASAATEPSEVSIAADAALQVFYPIPGAPFGQPRLIPFPIKKLLNRQRESPAVERSQTTQY